jgi:4-hydroxy-2-oxoheptanedioate aldolase
LIEVEHGGASFSEVEACAWRPRRAGAVRTVRLPDHHRHHVLRALEVGARIVVVPMVNDAEIARDSCSHGKFPPLGSRGFNTRSRGLNYGLDGLDRLPEVFARANATTHLIAQIETREAVDNLDAICAVEGLSGRADRAGRPVHELRQAGRLWRPGDDCAGRGHRSAGAGAGKHAGILVAPGPMLDAALAAGCDLFFCGGDVNDLAKAWRAVLAATEAAARGAGAA